MSAKLRRTSRLRHAYVLSAMYLLLLVACAGQSDSNSPPGGGGGGGAPDGGASIPCTLSLLPPTQAAVGQPQEVSVSVSGQAFGVRVFRWSIDLDGVSQPISEVSDPLDRIVFTPAAPGPYRIQVEATIGEAMCLSASTIVAVVASGARFVDYRMRVVPRAGAPMQDVAVRIYGGSNAVLPNQALPPGALATGRVVDTTGNGVAAYIRARKIDVPTGVVADFEGFSDIDGAFSLLLPSGPFDLLVMPNSTGQASTLFRSRTRAQVGSELVMPAPASLAGRLLNASGTGVAGARVTLQVDGARSSEGISASDGSFTVLASGSALSGVSVAPPPGSGMPSLRSDSLSGQSINQLSTILIRYADASISVQVDVALENGAAAVGSVAEWRAELPNAGTVEVASTESLGGTLRVRATANSGGRLQTPLVARSSHLVIHSQDGSQAVISRDVDWVTAPLSTLALRSLVSVSVSVAVAAGGEPLANAVVRAVPTGVLAPEAAVAHTQTAADGSASLLLVEGGNYLVSATERAAGQVATSLLGARASASVELALAGTIVVKGQLHVGAQPAAGAQIRLFCDRCTGVDPGRVRAVAVADSSGHFVFRVADPGVDPI